jgi:hypothetical protein
MFIANSYDDFVDKIVDAEKTVLNSPAGQALTQSLLKILLTQNPDLTPDEWQKAKSEFLTFLFAMFIKEYPEAMRELSQHVWDELQNRGNHS